MTSPLGSYVIVEPSAESLETWRRRAYISEELCGKLASANALIVPSEGYTDHPDWVYFPNGTEELYHFLQEKRDEALNIEICIEDNGFNELALHADILQIAAFVVENLVAPTAVALIAEYIVHRLKNRLKETDVQSTLTIQETAEGRSIQIHYKGPAEKYLPEMRKALARQNVTEDPTKMLPPPAIPKTEQRRKTRTPKRGRARRSS